jgi:hypothetical protein
MPMNKYWPKEPKHNDNVKQYKFGLFNLKQGL